MENLIEELTKVNPSNLSEEGLKLFNKIMEIIDRNEELEKIKQEKLNKYLYENQWICKDLAEHYIHKSKVREKKEFLERKKKKAIDNDGFISVADEAQIQLCEELLQEGDK